MQAVQFETAISNGVINIPETMLMSECSLAKVWNTPEEDEAWNNL